MSAPNQNLPYKVKSNRFTEEELRFIEQNYRFRTDIEIARILGRQPSAISRQRDKYKWKKDLGRPGIVKVKEGAIEAAKAGGLDAFTFAGLTKDQRIEIYKENFDRNKRYALLLAELHKDELEYYRYKYIEFLDGVDTITLQEEDTLHHMIMADISISRTRRKIRDLEADTDQTGQPMVWGLYEALNKFEDRFTKYQQTLRVTREGRLKEDREQKETWTALVQAYRTRLAKEEMGNNAALMDLYKNKCYEEMKTSRYLLGDLGV